MEDPKMRIWKIVLCGLVCLFLNQTAWSKPSKKLQNKPRSSEKKSGAVREEGWVYTKTSDGRTVKAPRKQVFEFEGAEVGGTANRPSQSVLGQRPAYQGRSLIPERQNFRADFEDASGIGR
jgi:hypothetical protein